MSSTHFGYQTVDEQEKARKVRGVFDSVAPRYDVMNDLMSMGLHRVWKAYTVMVATRPPQLRRRRKRKKPPCVPRPLNWAT